MMLGMSSMISDRMCIISKRIVGYPGSGFIDFEEGACVLR